MLELSDTERWALAGPRRSLRRVLPGLIVALAFGAQACQRGSGDDTADISPPTRPRDTATLSFGDAFVLVKDLALPDSGPMAVASIHSLDVRNDGTLLIADRRSHNLKLLTSTGTFIRAIGRLGSGPGEFREPFDARFTPSGGIVVADPELVRVTVLDSTYQVQSTFTTVGQDPRLILPAGDSGFLIAGLVDVGRSNNVLAYYGSDGHRVRTFLRADTLILSTRLIIDQPWLARAPNGAFYAGMAMVPNITRVDVGGNVSAQVNEAPPGWIQLRPPSTRAKVLQDIRQWIQTGTIGVTASSADAGGLLIAFQQEFVDSTGYTLVAYDHDLHDRQVYTGVPARLAVERDNLLYLVDEAGPDSRAHVLVYRHAQPH